MKTKFIARVAAILLTVPILILIQAPNGSANIGDDHAGGLPAAVSCTDKSSVFPTSLFTRLKTNANGTLSGFEIHLSNQDRSCSTILYAFTTANNAG